MEYKIIFWDDINNDLDNISDYIERMTFSINKAEQIVWKIIGSMWILSIFPYMYQVFYKDYRSINIENKRIIYYIDEEKKIVIIYRILWQAQNYEEVL